MLDLNPAGHPRDLRCLQQEGVGDSKILTATRIVRVAATIILVSVLFAVWVEVIPVWTPISIPMDLFYSSRDIFIHATVSSREPEFAERVPVTVHAFGSIGVRSVGSNGFANVSVLKNVLTVCVVFSGAYQVVGDKILTNFNPEPSAGSCLGITITRPRESYNLTEWMEFGPGAFLVSDDQTIEWLSPTTQSVPSIIITYNGTLSIDGVLRNTISESYPDKSLQIEPNLTLQSDKAYLKDSVVGIIVVVLGLIQAIPWAIRKRKQRALKSPKRPSRAKSRR